MAIKKVINIDIQADSKKAEKDLKSIRKDIDDIGKSAEKNLTGDNLKKVTNELKNTETAAKNTKNRLRELEDEMADIGDVNSPQFQKLAKEAGVLKDKINNAKAAVKAMSADFPKLQVGTQALQAMGGAAQGAMGAMALVGDENEAITKSIQKMMAVQSMLNAVTTVSNALSDETALGLKLRTTLGKIKIANDAKQTASTGTLTVAQKGLTIATWLGNGAMAALNVVMSLNPIALVVIAIAALGAGIMYLWKPIKNLISGFESITDKMGAFGKIMKYTLGFILLPFILAVKGMMMALEALGLVENDAAIASKKAHAKKMAQVEEELAKQKELKRQLKLAHEAEQANLTRLIALTEAQGKSSTELTKEKIRGSIEYQKQQLIEIENNINLLKIMTKSVPALKSQFEEMIHEQEGYITETNDNIKNAEQDIVLVDIKAKQDRIAANKEFLSEKQIEERRVEDLRQSLIKDDLDRELAIRRTKFARDIEDLKTTGKLGNETKKLLEEELQRDLKKIAEDTLPKKLETLDLEVLSVQNKDLKIVESASMAAEKQKKIDKDLADFKKARNKETASQSVKVAMQGFQAVAALATSFAGKSEAAQKRAFNINKAANIAQATIDTYKGAQAAFASGSAINPVFGFVSAAAAIAMGVANIKNIASTSFEGGSGASAPAGVSGAGGGAGSGASGGGGNVANFNVVGNTGVNQLAESLGDKEPVKAFVVSSDVTTAQSLDRNKVDTATL